MWWIAAVFANPCREARALHEDGASDAEILAALDATDPAAFKRSTPDCMMREGLPESAVREAALHARPAVHTFPEHTVATAQLRPGLQRQRTLEVGLGAGATLTTGPQRAESLGRVGALFAWHPTPIFGAEIEGTFMIAERADRWKAISRNVSTNNLVPEVTRAQAAGVARAVFSPVSGEVRTGGSAHSAALDLGLGFGAVYTVDDLEALQKEGDPASEATEVQLHPALSWSVGPRVALGDRIGLRVRLDGLHWIETYESVNLERSTRIGAGATLTARL